MSYDLRWLSNNMACSVIDIGETTSTTDVLEGLSEGKSVPDEVQKLLMTLNMIPEFKNQNSYSNQDKEVEVLLLTCLTRIILN